MMVLLKGPVPSKAWLRLPASRVTSGLAAVEKKRRLEGAINGGPASGAAETEDVAAAEDDPAPELDGGASLDASSALEESGVAEEALPLEDTLALEDGCTALLLETAAELDGNEVLPDLDDDVPADVVVAAEELVVPLSLGPARQVPSLQNGALGRDAQSWSWVQR